MSIKISFLHMDHSDALEAHTHQKLEKLLELLNVEADDRPFGLDIVLRAHAQHPHHAVEFHVKTKSFDLNAHEEGPDMYVAIDNVIDTMSALVKKEKDKMREKVQKHMNEKRLFTK